jgi:nitrite reductase/ring-hydroxylating ferredoxin subunit
VGPDDAFPEGALTPVSAGGTELVVVRDGGTLYAVPDRCTHAKFPLHDGELADGKIRCIHHGATFGLCDGKPTMPALRPLVRYAVDVEEGRVLVTL